MNVGVFVDLGLRRRRTLDVWPEVITAIEAARSVGEMWTRLDEAGAEAKFAVKAIQTEAGTPNIGVEVELEDRSGELDVWFAALHPMSVVAGPAPDPARNRRTRKKAQRRTRRR